MLGFGLAWLIWFDLIRREVYGSGAAPVGFFAVLRFVGVAIEFPDLQRTLLALDDVIATLEPLSEGAPFPVSSGLFWQYRVQITDRLEFLAYIFRLDELPLVVALAITTDSRANVFPGLPVPDVLFLRVECFGDQVGQLVADRIQ